MPIYEYECPECGEKFELRRSMADCDDDIECPECHKGILKRVLSLFSAASSDKSCVPSGSS